MNKIDWKTWIIKREKELDEYRKFLSIKEPDDPDALTKQIAVSSELIMSIESIRNAVDAVVSKSEEEFNIWWSALIHQKRMEIENNLPKSRQISERQIECALLSSPIISKKYIKRKCLLRRLLKLRSDWRSLADAINSRDYALGNLVRLGLKGVPISLYGNNK